MEEIYLKRLSDCEVILAKYHNQLESFIKQVVNYNNQIISKQEFEQLWKELNSYISRDFGMIRKEMSDIALDDKLNSDKLEAFNILQNNHHSMLFNHEDKLNGLKNDVEGLQVQFASHEKKIVELLSKMPNWEKVSLAYEEFKKNMYFLLSQKEEHIEMLKNKVENIQKVEDYNKKLIDQCNADIPEFESKLSDIKSKIYDRVEEVKTHIEAKLIQVKAEINVKMEQKPIVEQKLIEEEDSGKDEVSEKIKRKIDKLAIESEKSEKKLNLVDIQMRVLEKKLDKILAILDKNELK